MPRLTIDGRPIDVPPGTSLLEAARCLGIEIPTLCYRGESGTGSGPGRVSRPARSVKTLSGRAAREPGKNPAGQVRPGHTAGGAPGMPSPDFAGLHEEPLASCFLCVVQVEGQPTLTPSCSAEAEDGMVVVTDSPDIRDARRTALELLLSDHVGDCLAPCVLACPAGLDVPGFLADLLDGRGRDATARVRDRLPFAASLGRICPQFCESVCRRGEVDEPIAIRALHRYVADGDARKSGERMPGERREPGDNRPMLSPDFSLPPAAAPTGKRVAIVGAGPAGLTAAFDLLKRGHAVTIFDRRPEPGGRFRWTIPDFELPAEVVDAEVELVRRLGAAFRLGTTVGQDVAFEDLTRDFDAVLLAVGAEAEPPLDCPGGEFAQSALAYLERKSGDSTPGVPSGVCPGRTCPAGSSGTSSPARPDEVFTDRTGRDTLRPMLAPEFRESIVVIGSDRAAVATARTALRRGADTATVVWPARRPGAGPLAQPVANAEAEGVCFHFQTAPVRIERRESGDRMPGEPPGVCPGRTCPAKRIPGPQGTGFGKASARPDQTGRGTRSSLSTDFLLTAKRPDGEVTLAASVVLNATGRGVEPALAQAAGLSMGRSGLEVDRATLATQVEGVFAAGEAVIGASYGVRAVAAGHQVAASIDQYLTGRPVVGLAHEVNVRMTHLAEAERDRLLGHVAKASRAGKSGDSIGRSVPRPVRSVKTSSGRAGDDVPEDPAGQDRPGHTPGGSPGMLSPDFLLAEPDALAESARCLQCTCLKVDVCLLRRHGTTCGADVRALAGHRREYQREETHPDIIYEPGKCILCGICVRLAEEAREVLGLTFIGRGFQVRTAAPFGEPLQEALRTTALAAAEACPTGAIAVRGRRRPVPGSDQNG